MPYAAVHLNKNTKYFLDKVLSTIKKKNDYHCTVIYDTRKNIIIHQNNFKFIPVKAKVSNVSILGTGKWKALVLTLESKQLHKLHNRLLDKGYEHSYKNYLPHISIKYAPIRASDVSTLDSVVVNLREITLVFDTIEFL